jgi:hypothetical protein
MFYRDYASLGGQARWKSRPLAEILPAVNGQQITVEYLAGEGIASPIDELAIMALVTAAGRTTTADGTIIGKSEPGVDYRGKPASGKIRQLYGDSRTFDFAPHEGTVDLFLVDGAHDYASARSDTERALACTRDGGWILWHDFGNYGEYNDVTRAVLELVPNAVQIGNTQLAIHRKA